MRKFVLISLVFFVIATPGFTADGCYGQKLVHNVERLTTNMKQFGSLAEKDMSNYQTRISLAVKIGQFKEVIKSGKNLKDTRMADGNFQSAYISMLDSFGLAMDELTKGIRYKDSAHVAKAKEYLKNGMRKMIQIRNALQKGTS